MDEYLGGRLAAEEFLQQMNSADPSPTPAISDNQKRGIDNALFINTQAGNKALDQRYQGFRDQLQWPQNYTMMTQERMEANNNTLSKSTKVRQLALDEDKAITQVLLLEAFQGCPYDVILLTGTIVLEDVSHALYENGCNLDQTRVGTFDVSFEVYNSIAVGKLSFAVSQQHYLQGAFGVWMATLYVTQNKRLAPPFEHNGVYFSGPRIINLESLPSDMRQICEADSFPICPNNMAPDGVTVSRCPCIDRSRIKIGGVIHGTELDEWSHQPRTQAEQAATDLGVQLDFKLLSPQTDALPTTKMAARIQELCRVGVDGLFVSIPNVDELGPIIQECLDLEVPVVSVNAGNAASRDLGLLHHVGQIEFVAGYGGGQRLVAQGMTRGLCPLHEPNQSALLERCSGFAAAIADSDLNVTYLGTVNVERDHKALNQQAIEAAVGIDGDWDGVGILALGDPVVEEAVQIKQAHPNILAGTFDINDLVVQAMEDDVLLFAIDQDLHLQGYVPVWLLTLFATTGQKLINFNIETGPRFIEEIPSPDVVQCAEQFYNVCPPPYKNNMNQLTQVRPIGYALVGIVFATSLFFLSWVFLYRDNHRLQASQPIFLALICFGAVVSTSSIIPLGLDDSVLSPDGCSKACMSVPWLFTTGFTIIFASLFAKLWRINTLIAAGKKFKRTDVSIWRVMTAVKVLLLLNVIFLLAWTLVDPMVWIREDICGSGDQSSYGYCSLGETKLSLAMGILVLLENFAVAILAAVEAYKAKDVKLQMSESRYIFLMMLCIVQGGIIVAPLIAVTYTNPVANYLVQAALAFVLSMTVLGFMFVPKMMHVHEVKGYLFSGAAAPMRSSPFEADVWVSRLRTLEGIVQKEKNLELQPYMERSGIFLPMHDKRSTSSLPSSHLVRRSNNKPSSNVGSDFDSPSVIPLDSGMELNEKEEDEIKVKDQVGVGSEEEKEEETAPEQANNELKQL